MGFKLYSIAFSAVACLGYVAIQYGAGPEDFVAVDGRVARTEEFCSFERDSAPRSKDMPCKQAAVVESEFPEASLKRQWRVEVFYVSPVDRMTHSAQFVTRSEAPRVGQSYRIYAHTSQLGMIRDF